MKTRTVFGMKKQPALWPFQRVGFCDFFELRWCLGVQGQFLGGGRVMGGGKQQPIRYFREKGRKGRKGAFPAACLDIRGRWERGGLKIEVRKEVGPAS